MSSFDILLQWNCVCEKWLVSVCIMTAVAGTMHQSKHPVHTSKMDPMMNVFCFAAAKKTKLFHFQSRQGWELVQHGRFACHVWLSRVMRAGAGCETGWRSKVAGKTSIGHVKVCSVICMCPYALGSFNSNWAGVSCSAGSAPVCCLHIIHQ